MRRHAVRAANERDGEALWDLVEAYLALRGSSGVATSSHTLRAYRRGIDELLVMWGSENLLRPSRDAGAMYVQSLLAGDRELVHQWDPPRSKRGRRVKKGPLSRATVGLRVAAGRALYDALAWAGATEADPFRDVRLGRAEHDPGQVSSSSVYSDHEIAQLFARTRGLEERVMLLLGADAGLRVSEMLGLRWTDVDLVNAEITIRGGKGGKTASVILSPRLAEILGAYKREAEAHAAVSVRDRPTVLQLRTQYGVYNRLRRLCLRAGVSFKGVHALRHSAGTRLYRQTGDLGLVQDHLRHATLDMARRYARSDRRRLRRSLEDWE